jgi:uncharacterized repeat protein (TIGR03833 family)
VCVAYLIISPELFKGTVGACRTPDPDTHRLSGKLTEGTVSEILTKSATHPHGIKVRLTSGVVGRVKAILSEGS